MSPRFAGGCLIFACLIGVAATASAHDSWISRGQFKNQANEWCCGDIDCVIIPEQRVHANGIGYELIFEKIEVVPYGEALPSMDGQYWRCHKPDGTRRCFFAPRPSV
jgi:hypothetical protein